MSNLIKKIQNAIFQNNIFEKNAKIIIGVSGGPDSVFLLEIFGKLQKKYNLDLIIAHVNYNLRGKDSKKDQELVEKLAKKYAVKIEVLNLTPALSLKRRGGASENELRKIRYEFFEKIRKDYGFDLIAVAHNSDDQVETFLMRLIRGSGMKGLSGMRYKNVYPVKYPQSGFGKAEFNRGTIIRPLLGISKKEISEYLKKNNLSFRIDQTNSENLFLRNKIRNKLIPYLEKNFNPNIRKTIFDSTFSIAEDYAFISELVKKNIPEKNYLSVKEISVLHPSLQRNIIFEFIKKEKPDLKDIESAHIKEILKAFRSTKGKNQIVSFKGLKMARKGDKVTIVKI